MNTLPEMFYCANGGAQKAAIAIKYGYIYGAQMPGTIRHTPYFIDQDWRSPNREKYMKCVRENSPRKATVLDLETPEQLCEVLDWASEISEYVTEDVIIIPKYNGAIEKLPCEINGKRVVLGYSVPTKYSGTTVPVPEFYGRPVHLLGGSPKRQKELWEDPMLDVVSCDSNYLGKISNFCVAFYQGKYRKLRDVYLMVERGAPYYAFELSCINTWLYWNDLDWGVRFAKPEDLTRIKELADRNKKDIGFISRAALEAAIEKLDVFVAVDANDFIVGFVNRHFATRGVNKGFHVVYELCVDGGYRRQGVGRALMYAVPRPLRLKSTTDNEVAKSFYQSQGLHISHLETGKKRMLYAWERS